MARAIKTPVAVAPAERTRLEAIVKSGTSQARVITRARILLLTDRGDDGPAWNDGDIAQALSVTTRTLSRVRGLYQAEGLDAIRHHAPKRYRPRQLDGRAEARMITIACSEPPQGHARWTLRLLADRLVSLDIVDTVSYETVRRTLKKTNLSLGNNNVG